MVLFEKMG